MGNNRTRRQIVAYTPNLGKLQKQVVTETRTNGLISYSIRFIDSKGNLAMRANFVKMYDNQGKIIQDRVAKYDEIFKKYGEEEIIYLGRK